MLHSISTARWLLSSASNPPYLLNKGTSMARSNVVTHTEETETSWLFNGFLALAIGWLLLTATVGGASVNAANADVGTTTSFSE